MNIEEINKYINFGSTGDICIYRELLLPEMSYFVESIYIRGAYNIIVEFDSLESVNSGDGWRWESSQMSASELINSLESFIGKEIKNWENISKTGKLSFTNQIIDINLILQEEQLFKEKYNYGKGLIPNLPQGAFWIKSPFGLQKQLTDNINEYVESFKELYCNIHVKNKNDLESFKEEILSILDGKLNDGLIECTNLLIEIHKSQLKDQSYCMECYPIDWEHNNYQIFIQGLKNVVDKLIEHKINYQIEL
ncbi:hypothetical protein DKL61_09640 [Gammaproteobacteria bacterium ESL0073]|nr:hypothetical protein DKL61_09640 [Gammaproteobacteria bacterium ESL0073]